MTESLRGPGGTSTIPWRLPGHGPTTMRVERAQPFLRGKYRPIHAAAETPGYTDERE